MRIAIDVSIQDTPFLTGVEKAQRSILREIVRLDRMNDYLLISRKPVTFPFALPENFRPISLEKCNPSYLWRERLLPSMLRKEEVDIYHSPVSAIPVMGKTAKIATLHELPWVEKGHSVEATRRMWLFLNIRYARRIIAVSERTRQNIIKLYPDAASKVEVIHHGVDEIFQRNAVVPERAEVLGRFGIPDRPFFMYVGALRRKKNLEMLVHAFAELPRKARESVELVFAGVRNPQSSDLEKAVQTRGLKGRVHFPGYVTDEDLLGLYHHAESLLYPSLFEGFGLPPLEAMACGCPVVASSGGAIPEVVGDAAIKVDPHDLRAWRDSMERLLTDRPLVTELKERGFQHVQKYTWRKTASRVLAIYQAIVDESNAREKSAP